MDTIVKPLRVQPAFDEREAVRALFYGHARYQAMAAYLPVGSEGTGEPRSPDAVVPYFRATWAVGGQPRAEGVAPILHNRRFINAAMTLFNSGRIVPKTVLVNVNAPMPAGAPHIDTPTFNGATRETLPLRLLAAMGASGLFEEWRIVEASVISWFYDGPGGAFDYWPDGPNGPMCSERSPFGNVAIIGSHDRMYHRIGRIGESGAVLPRMSTAAEIRPAGDGYWSIFENGEQRACYPPRAVRLSVLWKATVLPDGQRLTGVGSLSPDRIIEIIRSDLHRKGVAVHLAADPLTDAEWVAFVYRTYMGPAKAAAPQAHD